MKQDSGEACSPIACVLGVLNAEERRRHGELASAIRGAVRGVRELDDGYAIALADQDDVWRNAAEFISLERRCCPFLEFGLRSLRERGGVELVLTGREGVKSFLAAEFGLSSAPQLTQLSATR